MKPRIVGTAERTDGFRWMIEFGWVDEARAVQHLQRMDAIGAKRGMAVDRGNESAQPLVWTEDLPRAIEIATKFPLAA